jgi:predicted Zn-dependent protease
MKVVMAVLALGFRERAGSGLLMACLIAGLPQALAAQSAMACHSMGTRDELPPDKLPVPERLGGIGNVHLAIRAKPEAQMWFDQGLNLLHDFWDYEAARAFEQSVRVDPDCAMCYWGIYQAEMFYHSNNRGYYATQALNKAMSLRNRASKAGRLYIEAGAAHEEELKSKEKAAKTAYQEVEVWRKLVKYRPHDTQARIFLAEALVNGYNDAGEPRDGQKEALAILQSVLKDEPNNSAANHYWIHAVEAGPHPEQALHSAEILASLAPASGHMVHMPGHIFFRMGDYARAQTAFVASMAADESYMQTQRVQTDDDWNYVHNLMYAVANLMEEGKLNEATSVSAKLVGARGELESTLYPWSARDSISRLDPRLPVALRSADWAQALELLQASQHPPAALSNLTYLARQLTEFATGMQALEMHDVAKAEEASGQLDAELWRFSQQMKDTEAQKSSQDSKNAKDSKSSKNAKSTDTELPKLQLMPDALPDPLVTNLSIMSLELRAGLLAAKQQTQEAKRVFEQAVQEEKALGYREPPGYIRPVGETEGAMMIAASDWSEAKAAYQKALVERPNSGFSLYGIALASERAGDNKAATKEYAEFLKSWANADPALPQLAHARSYVADHEPATASVF